MRGGCGLIGCVSPDGKVVAALRLVDGGYLDRMFTGLTLVGQIKGVVVDDFVSPCGGRRSSTSTTSGGSMTTPTTSGGSTTTTMAIMMRSGGATSGGNMTNPRWCSYTPPLLDISASFSWDRLQDKALPCR